VQGWHHKAFPDSVTAREILERLSDGRECYLMWPLCAPDRMQRDLPAGELMVAQADDPFQLEWICNAQRLGGNFLSSIAQAALVADIENYPLMRPLIAHLRKKYPAYEPTEQVKQEIRDRK
jgi:hypothetical protein